MHFIYHANIYITNLLNIVFFVCIVLQFIDYQVRSDIFWSISGNTIKSVSALS